MNSMVSLPAPLLTSVLRSYQGPAECRDDNLYYSGEGVLRFREGQEYEGEVCRGVLKGEGKCTWTCGTVYEGEWEGNAPHGKGCMTWTKCGLKYTGQFKHGKRHGIGELFVGERVLYSGQWEKGLRHGQGMMSYFTEDATYTGTWVQGKRHGKGKMSYGSGSSFEGEWADDLKSGYGVIQWASLGQTYEGKWLADKPHGYGVHTWERSATKEITESNFLKHLRCHQYHGIFAEGAREGHGHFLYSDGSGYVGQWRVNQKHGFGRRTSKGGLVFEGEFIRDRPVDPVKAAKAIDRGSEYVVYGIFCEEEADTVREMSSELGNALVRWRTVLRKLYYDIGRVKEKSVRSRSEDLSMLADELKAFFVERGVFNQRLKRDWYAGIVEDSMDTDCCSPECAFKPPVGRLLFRHFLMVLVKCAEVKYHNDASDPPERLDCLLEELTRARFPGTVSIPMRQPDYLVARMISRRSALRPEYVQITPRKLIGKMRSLGAFESGIAITLEAHCAEEEDSKSQQDLETNNHDGDTEAEPIEPAHDDSSSRPEDMPESTSREKMTEVKLYCSPSMKQILEAITQVVHKVSQDEPVQFDPEILDYSLAMFEFMQVVEILVGWTTTNADAPSVDTSSSHIKDSVRNSLLLSLTGALESIEKEDEQTTIIGPGIDIAQ